MEDLYHQGKLRCIGVCNYTIQHLQDLLATCTIKPMVHQFELHPLCQQQQLVEFCQQNGIAIQAYSSLGQGQLVQTPLLIPGLQDICRQVGRTPGQVLLRWALQKGYSVLPKSCHAPRIRENMDLNFTLNDEVTLINLCNGFVLPSTC